MSSSAIVVFFASSFRYWERESVMAAIDRLEYIAGTTNTSGALDVSRIFVFNTSRGDRPYATNVAVIITDGKATDPTTVQPAIDRLHAANVTTYVIGVTDGIDEQSLKQLASDPKQASSDKYHHWPVKTFISVASSQSRFTVSFELVNYS